MKISHNTRVDPQRMHTFNGYGYATDRMLSSLRELGYEVSTNDKTADVGFWFDQPQHWKWPKNQYRIGYHPWESTQLQKGWLKKMNQCDEVWTPSPVVADWYLQNGVKRPIFVYEHGVDSQNWTPVKREVHGPFKFLHVGGDAVRKGADIALDAFRIVQGNNKDVELTLKMNNKGWHINRYGSVTVLTDMMSLERLVRLYHRHHAFVYPSWGEGFGLLPLQAMSTAMPTISTAAWAPYKRFLDPMLSVSSELSPSPWEFIHPGCMWKPNFEEVVENMRYVMNNYEQCLEYAALTREFAVRYYDWNRLTKIAFTALENRLKNS